MTTKPIQSFRTLSCWRFQWFRRKRLTKRMRYLPDKKDLWGGSYWVLPIKIEAFCALAKQQAQKMIQAEKLKRQRRRASKVRRKY